MLLEETKFVREKLDGAGSVLKDPFVREVRKLGRTFECAFEWCSGIGEIGYAILQNNLCKRLCLADINPAAIEVAREIAMREGLEDKVDIYISDNMDKVPAARRFDLVVANPPNFYNVQKDNPYGARMYNDLRPNDRGWKIHEKFYSTIGAYLLPGAVLLIEEIEPFKKEVFMSPDPSCKIPYDIRDEVPMETFERMTRQNGLKIVDTSPLLELSGIQSYVLKIVAA